MISRLLRTWISVAMIVFLCKSAEIAHALVTNEAALVACIGGTESTCELEAGRVITLTAELSIDRNLTILGSVGSIIDLGGNVRFTTIRSSYLIIIKDLEIRNGASSYGAFLELAPESSLSLFNVVVRNMSASVSGAIYGTNAHAELNQVTFIDCNALSSSVFEVVDPKAWVLSDVSFINCSSSAASLASTFAIYSARTSPLITFGGSISFMGSNQGLSRAPHFAIQTGSTDASPHPITVLSSSTKPSVWSFTDSSRPPILLFSSLGNIGFQVGSLSASDLDLSNVNTAFTLQVPTAQYSTDIHIIGHMVVQGFGVLKSAVPQVRMTVGDTINSTNCRSSPAAITSSNQLVVIANSLHISNYLSQAIEISSTLQMLLNNFVIVRPSHYLSSNPALKLSGNVSIQAYQVFSIIGHHSESLGGAIAVAEGSTLSIKTVSLFLEGNSAYQGGAIYLARNASLIIDSSREIVFRGNSASQHGGAIAMIDNTSSTPLTFPGAARLLFKSNHATFRGGAVRTSANALAALGTASFWNNTAAIGCVVDVLLECQPFSTTGTYGFNAQTEISAGCVHSSSLCVTASVLPSSCPGSSPSVGVWSCVDGTWTSVGSLNEESVTIPGSQVVVVGNLTISGDLTFTGLESSVTILDGCAQISGTLKIELTPEELEEIAKDAGSSRTISLLSQNSSCTSLSALPIGTAATSRSCRKIEFTSTSDKDDGSSTRTLVAVFKVNSSGCNTKWIILGSVLGGVLLLVVIVLLLATFSKRFKAVIRPFSSRDQEKSEEKLKR